MQPPVVLFLVTALSVVTGAIAMKTLIFKEKTSHSYIELFPLKPLALHAFTLCMRVGTELKGEREVILFAYRTNSYDELNVWRELDGRLSFYLSGEGVLFDLPQLEALETHLCATWDSESGLATMYYNGKKSLSKVYKKSHTIRGGGRVILGQDPDSFLGDFEENQCFIGEISDVNMWDTAFPSSTIKELYSGERVKRGNVLDWEDIQFKSHGEVEVATREL